MISASFLALSLLLIGPAQDGPSKPHVQASLLSDVQSIQPGQPFFVGLNLVMEPGWHTYWMNPGDSGLPTRLAWNPPERVSVEAFEWPTPKTFATGPLVSYGYAGEVLLLARVTTPATLQPGQSLTLGGRASWLECQEICIPGKADLSLTLPVEAGAARPSAEAGRFAQTRDRLPQEAPGWHITAALEKQRLTLILRPPVGFPALQDGVSFFAEQAGLVEHGQPQKLLPAPAGARLEIPLTTNVARIPDRLRGVLLIPAKGGKETSLAVEVPLTGTSPSSTKGDRP